MHKSQLKSKEQIVLFTFFYWKLMVSTTRGCYNSSPLERVYWSAMLLFPLFIHNNHQGKNTMNFKFGKLMIICTSKALQDLEPNATSNFSV